MRRRRSTIGTESRWRWWSTVAKAMALRARECELGDKENQKLYGRSKQAVSYLDVIELKDPQCFLNLGIYGMERC